MKSLYRRLPALLPVALCMTMSFAVTVFAADSASSRATNGANLALVYGIVALLSALLVAGYVLWEKNKERKFLLLYLCVALVNTGYFLQAVSGSLAGAMLANRVSYFGAAYSMLMMLLIIMDVCRLRPKKWVIYLLAGISTAAFLLAASGTWQGLYYKSVSIVTVGGVTKLAKEYGPLHILYTVYLLCYFALMVGMIIRAARRGNIASPRYAVFLAAIVLGNIGVWAVEQFVDVDFEFLSVSYIATEVMLLLIYGMLRDYGILQSGGALADVRILAELNDRKVQAGELPPGMEDLFTAFAQKLTTLSAAERRILNYYIEGHEISDIPELSYISIHTVKKHNRSIYQKLGVSSRDELMLYIEFFRRCGRMEDLS